jgi:glycosyltransferase involved in cell wall biosynthesis
MRVLCVGNRYPPHGEGGYELVWQGAVRALRRAGHQVRTLTSDVRGPAPAGAPEQDEDVHRELRPYWHEHEFLPPLSPRARARLERHNHRVLARHLAAHRPQVVTWWGMGGMSIGLVQRVRDAGLPAVALVHDDWLRYGRDADQWARLCRRLGPLRGMVERHTGLPAALPTGPEVEWLFVSESTRRTALEGGLRLARTGVAPSGIHERFLHGAGAGPWRERLLYVGRIDVRKGIDAAVRALALLGSQARLTIVGDGHAGYRSELTGLVGELGLGERVELRPGVPPDALPEIYAAHDAVLFPVRWQEPWGLVPLEAMGMRRPVVASGRGGSGEYLRDGANCLLADPDDPRAIAAAVERLARDGPLRERLAEGGVETARRHTAEGFERRVVSAVEAAGA